MAKKSMNIKYKRKRERNKYKPELDNSTSMKSFVTTLIGVAVFLGLMMLMVWGMQKLGVFERGYTKPDKGETEISYEFIPIGTVFNRTDKEYYVLFDNYETSLTQHLYINTLVSDKALTVYKVDMSKEENAKYKGEEENRKATKATELSINDVTLIKINNGKIADYLVGSEEIEGYLNK